MKSNYNVALITGAASGLGRELARLLAGEGTAIAALDCNEEALAKLATEMQGKAFASAVLDVRDAQAVRAAVAEMERQLGPVDLLVASAGVGIETSALALRAEDMQDIIAVNLIGVSHSIAAVLPGMIERNRGHIVAISSLASVRGMPLMAGYCASKAGVNALMDSLRSELYGRNVQFTTVCPGWIRTPMTEKINLPLPNMLSAEEAARRILKAMHQRRVFCAFPPRLAWHLYFLRGLPVRVSDWLIARMLGKLKKA